MRKRIISASDDRGSEPKAAWLDLEALAVVEVSSEDPKFPVENALLPTAEGGWRAAGSGEQTLRLCFDNAQSIHRIELRFVELERSRTQEFVLRWSGETGQPAREIVRQQFTFGPPSTTEEVEDYRVALDGVRVIELALVPDISGSGACASLARLRLA